jgi:hypothetical protein
MPNPRSNIVASVVLVSLGACAVEDAPAELPGAPPQVLAEDPNGNLDEDVGVEANALSGSGILDTFDDPDAWWRLGAQAPFDIVDFSKVEAGSARFKSTYKTWLGRELSLTGVSPHATACRITLDTETRLSFTPGQASQGKLRVKVRDAVSGTVVLDQRWSLPTGLGSVSTTIRTDTWSAPSSRRVIVNLIADTADPNHVNFYSVDNLNLLCTPPPSNP